MSNRDLEPDPAADDRRPRAGPRPGRVHGVVLGLVERTGGTVRQSDLDAMSAELAGTRWAVKRDAADRGPADEAAWLADQRRAWAARRAWLAELRRQARRLRAVRRGGVNR
jgi:hypothetical protein